MTVTADDLDAALTHVVTTLRPAVDRAWSVPADGLDWTCWETADHIGDCLLSYAGQLVIRPPKRYVPFLAGAKKDATPAEVLEFAEMGGRILVWTLRAAPADLRADHPTGRADLAGWAGMGCVETLLHGDDIVRGLGLAALDPPGEICARVVARMFPEHTGVHEDPWTALRWCAGRIDLPDHPRRSGWQWRGDPL